jgi:hypothetical protein
VSQTQYSANHAALLTKALGSVSLSMNDLEGKSYGPASHTGAMIISPDPTQDNLGTKLITIDSVQHLKQLAGIDDSHFKAHPSADRAIHYPAAPVTNFAQAITRARSDNCALETLIHPDDTKNIGHAMLAYVNGDSSKVSNYEPVLNAMRFPAQGMLTVAQDVTVTPQNPLIIGHNSNITQDPVLGALCVFGTITIEPGGQIIVQVPVTIKAAKIISR